MTSLYLSPGALVEEPAFRRVLVWSAALHVLLAFGGLAAADCALFLWATVPVLRQAMEVLEGWGFVYKSSWSWTKDKITHGYWNRNKHEILLLGTRGSIPAP